MRGNTVKGATRKRRIGAISPMNGLRRVRLEKGLTQQDLADWLDCTKSHYGKFELGTVAMSFFEARKVAKGLGVAMEELA